MDLSQLSDEEINARIAELTRKAQGTEVAGPGAGSPVDPKSLSDAELDARIQRLTQKAQAREPRYTDDGVRTDSDLVEYMNKEARKRRGVDDPGKAASLGLGFLDWAGMGWGDEAVGLAGAAASYLPGTHWGDESFGDRYSAIKKRYEDNSDAAWEKHPWLYSAGAVPGFLGSAVLTPEIKAGQGAVAAARAARGLSAAERAAALRAAERAATLKTGAATGAAWGGIGGAGQGDDLVDRGLNAGLGALIGGAAGGALSRSANAISERIADRAMRRDIEDFLADRAQAEAAPFGITLDRGQRTGDVYTQAKINSMRETAYGPSATAEAQAGQRATYDAIGNQIEDFNHRIAGVDPATGQPYPIIRQPHEGGEVLKDAIDGTVARETTGLQASNAAAERQAQSAGNAMELGFGRGAQLVDNEFDVGSQTAQAVLRREAQEAAARDAAYRDAAQTPAMIGREAIDGMDRRVQENLTYNRDRPVVINEDTPRAREALGIISNVSEFRGPRNFADPAGMPDPATIRGVSPAGIETVRQRLVALRNQAWGRAKTSQDYSDFHAMRAIMDEFDDQLERAVNNGLFEGDPNWLEAYRRARGLHRAYMERYHPDGDLRRVMRSILDEDRDPVQVANYLYGRSAVGDTPASAKIFSHLEDILGADSEEIAGIKQHLFQRLLTTGRGENKTRAITHETATRIASQIEEFTRNRGRALAMVAYSSRELALMNRFAAHLRSMAASRQTPPAYLEQMIQIASRDMNVTELARTLTGGLNKPGQNTRAEHLIDLVETVYGQNSPQWSALRQTFWRQLTTNADGLDPKGAKRLASNLHEFLNGGGAPVARRLYPAEANDMRKFAAVLTKVAGSADAKNPPKTASHLMRLLQDHWRMIVGGLGLAAGDPRGAVFHMGTAQLAKMGLDHVNGARARRLVRGDRDLSASEFVKDKGDRFLLRQSRRGSLAAPVLGGHELAPAGSGALSGAFADDD